MAELRRIFSILGMVALLFFGIPMRVDPPAHQQIREQLFLRYINDYKKSYRDNETEYQIRFKYFQESLDLIEELNEKRSCNSSAWYGLTRFSDLDDDEFRRHHLRNNPEHIRKRLRSTSITRQERALLPQSIDWRTKGVVTPVYSQNLCGACWAFSTIEVLESMNAIQTGKLQKLSVQEAIDCSRNSNEGCAGGDICSLLQWMFANKIKIQPASAYPLIWQTGVCKLGTKLPNAGIGLAEFSCNSYATNEQKILEILANHGPVAVAINALTWQNYLGGVIQYHCDSSISSLNHAVQIVGYDLTAEIPHYIVRNSWGEGFGDKGYLKIAIGSNLCGLGHEVATLYV